MGANYCNTIYYFCGDENEIEMLHDILFNDKTIEDLGPIENNDFVMTVVTDFIPDPKRWVNVLENSGFKTIKMTFRTEEYALRQYLIYDPFNLGRFNEKYIFIVSACVNGEIDCENIYFTKKVNLNKEVNKIASKKLGKKVQTIVPFTYDTETIRFLDNYNTCDVSVYEFIIDNDISNYN